MSSLFLLLASTFFPLPSVLSFLGLLYLATVLLQGVWGDHGLGLLAISSYTRPTCSGLESESLLPKIKKSDTEMFSRTSGAQECFDFQKQPSTG